MGRTLATAPEVDRLKDVQAHRHAANRRK